MSKEIKINNRRSASVDLNDFCYLTREYDFMDVTLWVNGDGFDVTMQDQMFHLTYGQLKALRKMVKKLEKPEK
jgi:hypothetical protein